MFEWQKISSDAEVCVGDADKSGEQVQMSAGRSFLKRLGTLTRSPCAKALTEQCITHCLARYVV